MTRRQPQQARSKKRFEAILDAAEGLFERDGYDRTTMDAIAKQAGASIGSLYQFFGDKVAIVRALALRVHAKHRTFMAQLIDPEFIGKPWPEMVETFVDSNVAFHLSDSTSRALWMNLHLYGSYAEEDRAFHREYVALVEGFIGSHVADATTRQVHDMSIMVVHIVTSTILRAATEEPEVAQSLLRECKQLLTRYLEPHLR